MQHILLVFLVLGQFGAASLLLCEFSLLKVQDLLFLALLIDLVLLRKSKFGDSVRKQLLRRALLRLFIRDLNRSSDHLRQIIARAPPWRTGQIIIGLFGLSLGDLIFNQTGNIEFLYKFCMFPVFLFLIQIIQK